MLTSAVSAVALGTSPAAAGGAELQPQGAPQLSGSPP